MADFQTPKSMAVIPSMSVTLLGSNVIFFSEKVLRRYLALLGTENLLAFLILLADHKYAYVDILPYPHFAYYFVPHPQLKCIVMIVLVILFS